MRCTRTGMLDQPTLNPTTPHSMATPVNTVSGFQPIGGTLPMTQATQSTQVSHTQALNILESQSTTVSIIQKPTPVNVTDQDMMAYVINAGPSQAQPVTPVSFASTTQVRLETAIPPPVSQVPPQITPVWVHLLQITSVASTSYVAPSLTSQQTKMTVTAQPQQENALQGRKCGKKIT